MKQFLIIFLLVLLTIPAVRDLFKPGAYTSHDLTHHIVRTIHMDKILREGQFPPRWVGDLNWGYGYPLFLFNYPLPSIIAVGFHQLGLNFIWSVKMTMALSMIFSAVFAYIFLRYLFKSDAAGFVGGLFYLYAPIRFLNVYVSATFGNAVAFMFVPLIFWTITKANRGEFDKKSLIFGSLSLTGLILSHNIMALMFLPIIAFYWLLYPSRYSLFTIILGLGLSSWFLLPAVLEKSLIRYDTTLVGFYKTHFPSLGQLIRSHWGYGFSHPGTTQDDMSFQIGLAHILVVLLSVFVLFKKRHIHAIFFLIIFFVSVFLMLEISDPIWRTIPLLPYLQMPWRLLAVSVFSASILASWLVSQSRFRLVTTLFLSLAVLIANRNHLRINEILPKTDADYMTINNSTTMASEHLPKGADKFDNQPVVSNKISVSSDTAMVTLTRNTSAQVSADIMVLEPSTIKFNQVYFPGWQFTLDGAPVKGDYPLNRPLPEFRLELGKHNFRATFGKTQVRKIADIISLVSVLILVNLSFRHDFQPQTLVNNYRRLPS